MLIVKGKRIVNAKLKGIIEIYKKEKEGTLTLEEIKKMGLLKYAIKQSIYGKDGKRINKIEQKWEDKTDKKYSKYFEDMQNVSKQYENDEIDQEKAMYKIEKLNYQYSKYKYANNRTNEKPKNPFWKHSKEALKNSLNGVKNFFGNIGNSIANIFKTVPKMLAETGKNMYKTQYKARKRTIKGIKTLGRGAKFVGSKVMSKVKKVQDKYMVATQGMRDSADKEMQLADKLKQAKKERKTPRDSLDMDYIDLDHEGAYEALEDQNEILENEIEK